MSLDFLSFGEPLVGFYPSEGSSIVDSPLVAKTWGGDTSNFALGVARLGRSVSYLTRVGDDPFGGGFIKLWESNGVDVSLVEVDRSRKTGLYFVSFDGTRHSLAYYRKDSAASAVEISALDSLDLGAYRIVHLSGISLGMSQDALGFGLELIRRAKKAGATVSLDVNYRAAQWESREAAASCLGEALRQGVDILEITDDEMAALGWGADMAGLEKRFPGLGAMVLKKGKEGAEILAQGQHIIQESFDVAVVDTVGAGDSFDAGFLVGILEGMTASDAARFAAATAALTCTGRGPLEKMPHRKDVEQFLADRA